MSQSDIDMLKKFQKVLNMSNRIKQTQVAKMLGLSLDELYLKLFEWNEQLPFKIDEDIIIVDDLAEFTSALDTQFETWSEEEYSKKGKIETLNPIQIQNQTDSQTSNKLYKDYHGVSLITVECEVLEALEDLIGVIPALDDFPWESFGFYVDDTHVVGLGLCNKNLISLPDSIGLLSNLQTLSLIDNQLTFLPNTIGQLSKLKVLILSNNRITVLPDSIGCLTNLEVLGLGNNRLTSLPETIWQLSNLKALHMSVNSITFLPETLGHLNKLQELGLAFNGLTNLPETIGQLKNLQELDLKKNNISSLPETIGQLVNLQKLNLNFSGLSYLPETITQLVNLKKLNFDHNELKSLSGSIFRWLEKIKKQGCIIIPKPTKSWYLLNRLKITRGIKVVNKITQFISDF